MAQQARKATFEDFQHQTHEFEVITPDNQHLIIEVKSLTPDEVIEAGRWAGTPPEAPFSDKFGETDKGEIYRERDYNDDGFIRALERYRQRQMHAQILGCWAIEVPGETIDERLDYIASLPSWVVSALWKVTNRVLATAEGDIKHRPFRRS
jgi:hypothetical protein